MAKKIQNEEPRENVLDVIRLLAKERGIEEEALIKSIEEGMVAAFKREFSGDKDKSQIKNVQAEIDRETGEIFVYKLVTVVEEVLDPDNEIAYDEARAMDDEIELGDEIEIGIEVDKLGRLAASAAKSAISQKVRDAEYRRIQDEFSGRIGEIATGIILRNDARNIYVDIDRAEAVLPREGQIRGEVYRQNASMKFLVQCVEEHNGHPSITLSRTSVDLVKKLFELEVPEIKNGEVIINAVSREPGSRSKVAVYSRDENVDAKGACVGPRGARVQHIMEELGGEKIDIVDWNADPALFISEALQPAKVIRVDTEITKKEDGSVESYAKVIVPDQQFTLAIGRSGQNVRLAARLTGFKIDIKKESDEASEATQMMLDKFTVVEEDNEN
ncbi:MAG: transcription termination/antitermination protein NusA [Clostridiales bacterium]|nr:transcription termination/antitermination protein NusA [Clostridiales bacterium]